MYIFGLRSIVIILQYSCKTEILLFLLGHKNYCDFYIMLYIFCDMVLQVKKIDVLKIGLNGIAIRPPPKTDTIYKITT